MKTIIFIGGNKSGSSREAIKAAGKLGFFTVLLTDREIFLENRLDFPDVHQMILMELSDYDTSKGENKRNTRTRKNSRGYIKFY